MTTLTAYLSSINSSLTDGADFTKTLETSTGVETTLTIAVAKGATETSFAYTNANTPYNADWETGTIEVKCDISSGNGDMYLTVRADRCDSAGTLVESSTSPAEQNISSTAVYTFTIASMNWSAGNVGDRLRIAYIFRNNKATAARTVYMDTYTANAAVTTSITAGAPPTSVPLFAHHYKSFNGFPGGSNS